MASQGTGKKPFICGLKTARLLKLLGLAHSSDTKVLAGPLYSHQTPHSPQLVLPIFQRKPLISLGLTLN